MLGVEWANLTLLAAFGVGFFVGIIVTIRLAKVVATYLTDLRKRGDGEP